MCNASNPCNRSYKHHCFLPDDNTASPSLFFQSLKLEIGGHEPTIMHNAPSWGTIYYLAKAIKSNG